MKPNNHRHRIKTSEYRAFSGTVDRPRKINPRAHGNIVVIETCNCGAYRETNVNRNHLERGTWGKR